MTNYRKSNKPPAPKRRYPMKAGRNHPYRQAADRGPTITGAQLAKMYDREAEIRMSM